MVRKTGNEAGSLMRLPHYYSKLAPFKELFLTGQPVLTYHHVGRRPENARLRGLYLRPKLFETQIKELSEAGFSTARFQEAAQPQAPAAKRVFITLDDGFRDVFENALPVLRDYRFSAIEFLVADLLGKTSQWQRPVGDVLGALMDKVQVREWLAAGNEIGSHTLTHASLTRISITDAREQISASKKKLEDEFGVPIHHFCYPFGDWNPAVRGLVEQAGYQTACTTRFGVNAPNSDPLLLRRITARYASRSLKRLLRW